MYLCCQKPAFWDPSQSMSLSSSVELFVGIIALLNVFVIPLVHCCEMVGFDVLI